MKLACNVALLIALLVVAAPVAAGPADNFLEADGCDVMVYVEPLDPGTHTGSWLVESIFSGEQYTYTYDQADVLTVFAPDGLSGRQISYVNWKLEELGAKGTNRTEVRCPDTSQLLWTCDFDGEIIRGTRYPKGGIGGTNTFDPVTGEITYTSVNLVFCQGKR